MRLRRQKRRATEPDSGLRPLPIAPRGARTHALVVAPPSLAERITAQVTEAGLSPLAAGDEATATSILERDEARLAYVVIAAESPWATGLRKCVTERFPEVRCIALLV